MVQADIIYALTEWIEKNLDRTLSISEVAAKSGYSKWHLQRMFRAVTKQTLGGYIRERRLVMAAEALRKTQQQIAEIAMAYGYESQQTFSRVFRRQFAQTPSAYRHAMRHSAPADYVCNDQTMAQHTAEPLYGQHTGNGRTRVQENMHMNLQG